MMYAFTSLSCHSKRGFTSKKLKKVRHFIAYTDIWHWWILLIKKQSHQYFAYLPLANSGGDYLYLEQWLKFNEWNKIPPNQKQYLSFFSYIHWSISVTLFLNFSSKTLLSCTDLQIYFNFVASIISNWRVQTIWPDISKQGYL